MLTGEWAIINAVGTHRYWLKEAWDWFTFFVFAVSAYVLGYRWLLFLKIFTGAIHHSMELNTLAPLTLAHMEELGGGDSSA